MSVVKQLAATVALLAFGVQAQAVPDIAFGPSPFGPFGPTQTVAITVTATNNSTQPITICAWPEICGAAGTAYTFGGLMSIPYATGAAYDFIWGGIWSMDATSIGPGESETFDFARFTPIDPVVGMSYGFSSALQIFLDTPDHPMLGSAGFGGYWLVEQVAAIPEPASATLLLPGLLGCLILRQRRKRATETVA